MITSLKDSVDEFDPSLLMMSQRRSHYGRDYRELLELTIVFLGGTPLRGIHGRFIVRDVWLGPSRLSKCGYFNESVVCMQLQKPRLCRGSWSWHFVKCAGLRSSEATLPLHDMQLRELFGFGAYYRHRLPWMTSTRYVHCLRIRMRRYPVSLSLLYIVEYFPLRAACRLGVRRWRRVHWREQADGIGYDRHRGPLTLI